LKLSLEVDASVDLKREGFVVLPPMDLRPAPLQDRSAHSAATPRRPREVRFIVPDGYVHKSRPSEIDLDPETFSAPTDFSKMVRFPQGFLSNQLALVSDDPETPPRPNVEDSVPEKKTMVSRPGAIRGLSDDGVLHFSLGEIESEYGSSIRPLGAVDASDDLDAFLAVETRLEEEEEEGTEMIPNFHAIFRCVELRVPQTALKKRIQQVLITNREKHFVLLLLEPESSVEGIYVLEQSLLLVTKIWGDTPDTIADDETAHFWTYNNTTNKFVEQTGGRFTPFTDAITL
jgi:hypothetical protein